MIELLAITDDATPPAPPLVAVRSGGLSALCAPAGDPDEQVTADALWRREAVIEELMATRDLLPVRYGTRVADEAAAADALTERRDELEAGLARVRGAVELAVRIHGDGPEPAPSAEVSGREYLRARIGRTQAAARLHEPLAALARDSVVQPGAELLRAAYLVERDAVDAFVARVHELQREHPELAVLCTGPWPPYSFAAPKP